MNTTTSNMIWPIALVVAAVIGAVTFLVANGNLSGSDATTIYVLILGGLGITTGAHVTGNLVNAAATTNTTPAPATSPAAPVAAVPTPTPAAVPAMPVAS